MEKPEGKRFEKILGKTPILIKFSSIGEMIALRTGTTSVGKDSTVPGGMTLKDRWMGL